MYPIYWDSQFELPDGTGSVDAFNLTGTLTFEYGQPFILYGTMRAIVVDNGSVDFFHSATVTSTVVPHGAHIFNDGGATVRAGFHINAAPEPTTHALTLLGLGMLIWIGRRNPQSTAA